MDSLNILPIKQSLSFIQTLAKESWPLTPEQVSDCAAQVGWTLETTKEYSSFLSFEIEPGVEGAMILHSFGVPRVLFFVSEPVRGEDLDQKNAALNAHMRSLETELTALFGQPSSFTSDIAGEEYRWWQLPSGVCVRIDYATRHPGVAITAPRHESEPHDTVVVPSVQECLDTIHTWAHAPWPLPVSLVHSLADSVGWNPEEESSSQFFSTLPLEIFHTNPPYYTQDFFAEPDVDVIYGPRGANKISFPLADHWSMRTEAEAWPLIQTLMRELQEALTVTHGEPELGTVRGHRHYARWNLAPEVTLSIVRAPGASDVTVEYRETQDSDATGLPFTYGVDEVVQIIDEWSQTTRPMDMFDAAEIATGIGWFPQSHDWPDKYYTRVSPPASPAATVKEKNNQVWLVTFDVSMGTNAEATGHSHTDVDEVMTQLEAALHSRYGKPEASSYLGVHYRDWDTGRGWRVRIAYGLGMSSVWIYDPAHKATVESFTTQPNNAAQKTPTPSQTAPVDDQQNGANLFTIGSVAVVLAILGWLFIVLYY